MRTDQGCTCDETNKDGGVHTGWFINWCRVTELTSVASNQRSSGIQSPVYRPADRWPPGRAARRGPGKRGQASVGTRACVCDAGPGCDRPLAPLPSFRGPSVSLDHRRFQGNPEKVEPGFPGGVRRRRIRSANQEKHWFIRRLEAADMTEANSAGRMPARGDGWDVFYLRG